MLKIFGYVLDVFFIVFGSRRRSAARPRKPRFLMTLPVFWRVLAFEKIMFFPPGAVPEVIFGNSGLILDDFGPQNRS